MPEGKDQEALFDRLLVRFEVGYLLRPANLRLVLAAPEPTAAPVMTMADERRTGPRSPGWWASSRPLDPVSTD